jgi:hypothetical protein
MKMPAALIIGFTLATSAIGQQRLPAFDLSVGGNQSALNVTSPAVINPRRCILYSLTIINPGSGGTLTLNDAASVGAATSANLLLTMTSASLVAGQSFQLAFPVTTGLVVSSVPTGASINVAYSYSYGN